MSTTTTTPDLGAYLRRIGIEGDAAALPPTLDTLAHLVALHAAAIPFENIDVLARRVPALDAASLQRKLVNTQRGGYCFEQNHLFMAVLRALGFAVRPLEARVRTGVPVGVATGRTHMALRVSIDGIDHLADVGFGGLAPLAPLQLASRAEQPAGTGRYRFVEAGEDLLLQVLGVDGWGDGYLIGPVEPQFIDAEIGNWFVATHPAAFIRNNLLMGRAIDGGRMTLFNRTLSIFRPETAAPVVQTLTSRAEFVEAFADAFALQIAEADVNAVLRAIAERENAAR